MSETRTLESSLPGVIPHVGVATLVRADGTTQLTLCRALGRNRVALVAKRDLPVGEEVHFEIDVEGGMVRGTGRVERMHVGTHDRRHGRALGRRRHRRDGAGLGAAPPAPDLPRHYLEYASSRPELRLPKPLTVEETRESLRTPPPWREPPKSRVATSRSTARASAATPSRTRPTAGSCAEPVRLTQP